MRILVHICCGPCSIAVLQRLRACGHAATGFFFNPNIHPLAEYMRRRQGAAAVAERLTFPLLFADALPEKEQHWSDPWLEENPFVSGAVPLQEEVFSRSKLLPSAADPAPWLRAVAGREQRRCIFCWRVRLCRTANMAHRKGFDGFTSTLLYSRYQDHDSIRRLGEDAALAMREPGSPIFVYEDFRAYWQEGIDISRDWGIYRQPYCGCLFSEYERYGRQFTRLQGEALRLSPP